MEQKRHFTGLTDAEVIESRHKFGANILTPPVKETLWDKFKDTCKHWISISMFILLTISVIASFLLANSMGLGVWVMPIVILGSTILMLIVGFFGGFDDPLFRILLTAFILSIGIAIYEFEWVGASYTTFLEPVGIIVALILATGVAFFLERSNEKTFQSLNEVNDDTLVKVIRNNNVLQVPRKDIVVGDIVILETGEEIPADCLLLECTSLSVDESSLTGEPLCEKTINPEHFDSDATYPSNEIMKGTIIMEGHCIAKVQKVGDHTASGQVFEAAQVDEGDQTPLGEKLDTLADWITKISYVLAAIIIIGRVFTYFFVGNGTGLSSPNEWLSFVSYMINSIMLAVTLIVVAVPEGLPMSVTLSLAFSMRKLMKENTLPRTMHACETMGATSVICTDKTGTLTQNLMQVADFEITEKNDDLINEMIAVNTTAHLDFSDKERVKSIGNPTEGALLLWLNSRNINYLDIREQNKIHEQLPFTTENKYMATIVSSNTLGKRVLYVKGAPEIILGMCHLDSEQLKKIESLLLDYQLMAMRTLGLAYLVLPENTDVIFNGKLNISEINFAGIFAISDPIRNEVPAAINTCIDAGIQVKIVTGDTPGTAKEIARQIGLWTENDTDKNILTGVKFAEMSDRDLGEIIQDVKILSRARPNDKERLVRLLKSQDYVVAVTGDGTNDAPALNAADVGLSMGDGTAVAKEASDMTILDNSFSTISNAVMWGRSLYKNIQRFILFQMTINVVACLIVLIGAFLGTESPLTVTQMLWVNLIMDTFAAIALASLPPSKKVMNEKPRKVSDNIISKLMAKRIFGVGGFFTLLLLGILLIMQHSDCTSMADLLKFEWQAYNGLSQYELSLFFSIFVLLQFWNMFNAKAFMTGKSALANLSDSMGFITISLVILLGQIFIVEVGGKMFNVGHISPIDWAIIIISTSFVFIIGEVSRLVSFRRD